MRPENPRDLPLSLRSRTGCIKDTKKKREIIVTDNETGESKTYLIPYGSQNQSTGRTDS